MKNRKRYINSITFQSPAGSPIKESDSANYFSLRDGVSVARRLSHKGIAIGSRKTLLEEFQSPAGSPIKEYTYSTGRLLADTFQSPAGSPIKEYKNITEENFPILFQSPSGSIINE